MFTARELLQRGGNVRSVMRNPDKYKAELEEMIAYFPRGKRGVLECVAGDVTVPESLPAGGCRRLASCHSLSARRSPGGRGGGHLLRLWLQLGGRRQQL